MGTTVQYATLLASLVFSCMQLHRCVGAPTFNCKEDEQKALLQFKHGVQDPYGMLSSWVGMDCCSWWGVTCSNRTGRVIQLHLQGPFDIYITGHEINPCLLALQGLEYLDLSYNNFSGAQIPKFIGSFKRLRHLDLSWSSLVGRVPPELGELSSLRYLDLSWNFLVTTRNVDIRLEIEDGSWLSRLSSLHYLDLSVLKVKNFSRALQSIGMLPLLTELHFAASLISSPRDDLPLHGNFTSLQVLDLHYNKLITTLPSWLFESGSLTYLDLSGNHFMGHVPSTMANLTSLEFLDLSGNELEVVSLYNAVSKLKNVTTLSLSNMNLVGELPHWLGNLKHLKYLDLTYNQLSGILSERRVGQLSNLAELYLNHNYFDGVFTDAHFRRLTKLEKAYLGSNKSLVINISPEWTPPPQLIELGMDYCQVGPAFPAWLRKIENISIISMSNAEISDVIPDWFWNFSSSLSKIILSNNMIQGKLPTSLQHLNHLKTFDLRNNQLHLQGPFPQFSARLEKLLLSNNSLSRQISPNVSEIGIPSSICKLKELILLDLSGNQLSGEIPDCWDSNNQLLQIDLSNNKLSGTVPTTICSMPDLASLHLQRNNLSGGLPRVLQSCTTLRFIDLGNNKFNGSIPPWLGRMLPSLIVLNLQSNMFVGEIPAELGNLTSLSVLDLSHNMLRGPIPQSFANLNFMKRSNAFDFFLSFDGSLDILTKGNDQEYGMSKLSFPISIDMSGNNLSGQIPEALTTLDGLQNLNLFSNHLTGTIPVSIGRLQLLESLDLSFNNLTGEIPQTMADLNFLSYMNFSFNQLRGRIPSGGQFENHPDPSIYMGNADLCGFPLNVSCQKNVTSHPSQNTNNDHGNLWIFVSATVGFVTGFWALVGSLLLKTEWRIGYYAFIDQTCDKLYVLVAVKLVNIRRI